MLVLLPLPDASRLSTVHTFPSCRAGCRLAAEAAVKAWPERRNKVVEAKAAAQAAAQAAAEAAAAAQEGGGGEVAQHCDARGAEVAGGAAA